MYRIHILVGTHVPSYLRYLSSVLFFFTVPGRQRNFYFLVRGRETVSPSTVVSCVRCPLRSQRHDGLSPLAPLHEPCAACGRELYILPHGLLIMISPVQAESSLCEPNLARGNARILRRDDGRAPRHRVCARIGRRSTTGRSPPIRRRTCPIPLVQQGSR